MNTGINEEVLIAELHAEMTREQQFARVTELESELAKEQAHARNLERLLGLRTAENERIKREATTAICESAEWDARHKSLYGEHQRVLAANQDLIERVNQQQRIIQELVPLAERGCETQAEDLHVHDLKAEAGIVPARKR